MTTDNARTMPAAPLLEVRGLSRSFGGIRAIRALDLQVPSGLIFGVIGPNGAGKSTLFNLITGVLRPTSGWIRFAGEDIAGLAPHRIVARGIARTFQNLRIFHSLSVLENVLVAQAIGRTPVDWLLPTQGRRNARAVTRARELLDWFQLADSWDRPAATLAYGQQRRLEIARALATGPRLLLVDEPAAGMNPVESAELMVDLQLVRDRGVTLLLIEHDMQVVMGLCDRIAVMDFGEKISEGTPTEIQRDPVVVNAYFGDSAEAS